MKRQQQQQQHQQQLQLLQQQVRWQKRSEFSVLLLECFFVWRRSQQDRKGKAVLFWMWGRFCFDFHTIVDVYLLR